MKIAVISDLHLGSLDESDAFGHDDAEFLKFLGFLEANFERVVLLGDIWETLTCRKWGTERETLAQAQNAHREIAKRFERPCYQYIHGNHDIVAARLGVPVACDIEADGTRLMFTHGHVFDGLVTHARLLSELGVFLGGWIRRMGMAAVYAAMDRMDALLAGATCEPGKCPFQRAAVKDAHRRDVDIIVTGHTHVAARAEHGNRLFLNSGSCANGVFSYLGIDTRSGDYRVCENW
jgi:predicted phosphodiesterase